MKPFIKRYLEKPIKKDLKSKMVFLEGARQAGKTTLALHFLNPPDIENQAYMSWDDLDNRNQLKAGKLPPKKLLVLDELHKYSQWQSLLKGFYDKRRNQHRFLVAGSGHLGVFQKGGDSLQGRYHPYRLHPFSLLEMSKHPHPEDLDTLLKFGGFPEPLISQSLRTWRRWQKEKTICLVQGDVRDLERITDLNLMETLVTLLPEKTGSPLSIKSLREDLNVAHATVEKWVQILERLYFCFRIAPFGYSHIRAVKKERKLYLFDWSGLEDKGVQFENLVACQLLKYCHFKEDTEGHSMELKFIRDTDLREIDFVVLQDKTPLFAVECKLSAKQESKHINYFKKRTNIKQFYQVHLGSEDYQTESARVLPFIRFCKELNMP